MTDGQDGADGASRRIGLFVDLENLSVSGDRGLIEIDPAALLKALEADEGEVPVRRAYADWSRLRWYREAFLGAGFEQVQATHVNRWKNDLDMVMALDALEVALTDPRLQTVALASSDVDFAPLVRVLRRHGRRVVGLGWASKASQRFREQVDRFIDLEAVLGTPRPIDRRGATAGSMARRPDPPSAEAGGATRGDHRGDARPDVRGEPRRDPGRGGGPSVPDDAAERILAAALLLRGPGAMVTFGAIRQAACKALPDRPPQTWSKGLMLRLFEDRTDVAVDRDHGADQIALPITLDLSRLPLTPAENAADALRAAGVGFGGPGHGDAVEAAVAALTERADLDRDGLAQAVAADVEGIDGSAVVQGLIDSKTIRVDREDGSVRLAPDMDDPDAARYAADHGLIRRASLAGVFLTAAVWARLLDGDEELAEDFAGMLEDLGFCDPAFGTPKGATPRPEAAGNGQRAARPPMADPGGRGGTAFFDPRDGDDAEEGAPDDTDDDAGRAFAFPSGRGR